MKKALLKKGYGIASSYALYEQTANIYQKYQESPKNFIWVDQLHVPIIYPFETAKIAADFITIQRTITKRKNKESVDNFKVLRACVIRDKDTNKYMVIYYHKDQRSCKFDLGLQMIVKNILVMPRGSAVMIALPLRSETGEEIKASDDLQKTVRTYLFSPTFLALLKREATKAGLPISVISQPLFEEASESRKRKSCDKVKKEKRARHYCGELEEAVASPPIPHPHMDATPILTAPLIYPIISASQSSTATIIYRSAVSENLRLPITTASASPSSSAVDKRETVLREAETNLADAAPRLAVLVGQPYHSLYKSPAPIASSLLPAEVDPINDAEITNYFHWKM